MKHIIALLALIAVGLTAVNAAPIVVEPPAPVIVALARSASGFIMYAEVESPAISKVSLVTKTWRDSETFYPAFTATEIRPGVWAASFPIGAPVIYVPLPAFEQPHWEPKLYSFKFYDADGGVVQTPTFRILSVEDGTEVRSFTK